VDDANLGDVSCASGALCVAVDGRGRVLVGTLRTPNTDITKVRIRPRKHRARFRFRARGAPARTFECKLQRRGGDAPTTHFKRCSSPRTYRHLHVGRYVFEVRAKNAAGLDRSPARRKFRIKG
jgi:hypothetical protein